jgi:hypothetical protein
MKEYSLRVFENKELRKIFGLNRDEVNVTAGDVIMKAS